MGDIGGEVVESLVCNSCATNKHTRKILSCIGMSCRKRRWSGSYKYEHRSMEREQGEQLVRYFLSVGHLDPRKKYNLDNLEKMSQDSMNQLETFRHLKHPKDKFKGRKILTEKVGFNVVLQKEIGTGTVVGLDQMV